MSKNLQMKINIVLLIALIISLIIFFLKLLPKGYETDLLIILDLVATIPVLISALIALRNKKVTVDLLASIALVVSILHFEWPSVAFINLMITCARIFGDYTEGRADDAVKSLLKLRPEKVKLKTADGITQVNIDEVKVGDLVLIEAGDRVPVDGTIVDGDAMIDQSSLTGESLPVAKIKGQQVFSSTLNLTGSFVIKTQKVGKDTTFEKIIGLIETAQEGKVGIQTVADKFATIYIAATLLGSVVIFALTRNLNLLLSILLVACADDIAIAIPMAFWGAIAQAAKQGIIIKGGSFLEGLPKIKTLIADKTGTLTKGIIRTEKIVCFGSIKSTEALRLIASVEAVSEHPIAKAITAHAMKDGLKITPPQKFEEIAGKGINAKVNDKKLIVGSLKFMDEEKVQISAEERKQIMLFENQGYGVVFLAINKKLAALLTLADQVRPDARTTISKLRTLGVQNVIMLTGDNQAVAERVAKMVGVDTYHANLLPAEKLKYVKSYLGKKGLVAMVGDGVNDAASLKLADIGIAMGAIGSDAAIESADIALMQDDFSKTVNALKLGKRVENIAKQNFFIWGVVNSIGLVLVFSSVIGPQGAAVWNFVTDFFPIFNALRVFRYKMSSSS